MTKTNADKIKETAAEPTDEKALSVANKTESPPKGDGAAPYKEDFAAVYARLEALEKRLDKLEGSGAKSAIASDQPGFADVAQRVATLEKRLEGNIA